jgi:hypothetical protein
VTSPAAQQRFALVKEQLEQALKTEADDTLSALLVRHSHLPSPRPNYTLAGTVSRMILPVPHMQRLLNRWERILDEDLTNGSAELYLLIVSAHIYTLALLNKKGPVKQAWDKLQLMAQDSRHVVRHGVVTALVAMVENSEERALVLLDQAEHWTDGFLQASVMFETLAETTVLSQVKDGSKLEKRLDEATDLIEDAPRSAERSQGRRRLLEVMAETLPVFTPRFPSLLDWMVVRCATKQPELRTMWEEVLIRLEKTSIPSANLDPVRQALDASVPPRRDPTTYLGPTRSRGKKAHKRNHRQ